MASVQVDWDDETHRILRYEFQPRWQWEDFFLAVKQARDMMDGAPGDVGVIFDASNAPNINVPQNALTNFRNALIHAHEKNKIMVAVLDSVFARVVISSVKKLGGERAQSLQFAANVDEARKIIMDYMNAQAQDETPLPASADEQS